MKKLPSLTIVWVELLVACSSVSSAETNAPGEAQFLSHIRQLTFEGRRSGEGYFSPNGKALVFQSERETGNPFYQIYLLDLETGDSHRVSPGSGKTTCAFFRPNSDEVLFASTHLDSEATAKQTAERDFRASGRERRYSWDYDEHFDIFAAKRDGSRPRRLTSAYGYDAEASYSPDGKKIVFTSLRDAYPVEKLSSEDRKRFETDPAYFGEIYLMNADGSDQKRLTLTPGNDAAPFSSPARQRIPWRRIDTNGAPADASTTRPDSSEPRRPPHSDCRSPEPAGWQARACAKTPSRSRPNRLRLRVSAATSRKFASKMCGERSVISPPRTSKADWPARKVPGLRRNSSRTSCAAPVSNRSA